MSEAHPSERDRFSCLFLVLALGWAAVLARLLLAEPRGLSLLGSPDLLLNFGHAVIFAVLGGLLYLGFPKGHAFLLLGFLLTGGYGALLEFLQNSVPGRIADPIDGLTNVLGAAWGMSTIAALGAWREGQTMDASYLRPPLLFLAACVVSALLATYA